ncbi:MAG: tRNA (N6-isopentenyl adenosine(37)-C2)-methylthiotransferase MiaB [Polyangiales bacterium]
MDPTPSRRLALITFGCQMNVHDSQRVEEMMRADGYELVDDPSTADVIIVNTCSVREKAEQKLRSEAGRLKRHDAVLVIAGCVAQQEGERLAKDMPFVDAIVGPDNLNEIPSLVRDAEMGAAQAVRAVFDVDAPRFLTHATHAPVGASAFVTVMKGCDERCSFCVVPYTRGPERYRTADDIVDEIRGVVARGVREVVLLGQTVNSFMDPTVPVVEGADPDDSQFASLLRRIAREAPGLDRLRYTSPHPRHLTPSLIAAHADLDVLASHVHMPVQSGSDRVLRRMIRRYTRAEYVSRLRALLAARPGTTLSTDVIVGFPGETDEDFEATLSLVGELGFTGLFGFKYSPRPHTPALRLGDDVSEGVKAERLARLFELSESLTRAHLATLVGTRAEVLVEGPSRNGAGTVAGRTRRNEIVHLPAAPQGGAGAVVEVEITRANKHSLEGSVCRVLRPGPEPAAPAARKVALPVVSA